MNEDFERVFYHGRTFYFAGLFLGLFTILLLYNLFLFFTTRERSYIYYSLSVLFYIFLEAMGDPPFIYYISDLLVWTRTLGLGNAFMFYVSGGVIFYLLFTQSFLNLKEMAPKASKIITVLVCIYVLFCITAVFSNAPIRKYFFLTILATYLFCFVVGIYAYFKKYRPARFYILADLFLLTGIFLSIFNSFGFTDIHIGIPIFRMDSLGFLLFCIFLSFALGDKINILKQEREEAQAKALLHLEAKVAERTEEVTKQKEIIEEKNKDITASIHYAKRIQTALITPENYITKALRRLMGK